MFNEEMRSRESRISELERIISQVKLELERLTNIKKEQETKI
jgi:hypothetical protein